MHNNTTKHITLVVTSLGHQPRRWCPRLLSIALPILLSLCLFACHGILDDLYDQPTEEVTLKDGQLYIDASSWTNWYYLDLKTPTNGFVQRTIPTGTPDNPESPDHPESLEHPSGIYTYWYDVFGVGLSNHEFHSFTPTAPQSDPASWHIAVHRNNVRTNGGAVYETAFTSMKDLPESSAAFADATFTPDAWNELDVWTIQAQMLQGLIGNQGIEVNPVLSSWLRVDLPPVPPTFTLNNHVFIIRFSDNTYAAVQLENYQSPAGIKCCLTINYKYPY